LKSIWNIILFQFIHSYTHSLCTIINEKTWLTCYGSKKNEKKIERWQVWLCLWDKINWRKKKIQCTKFDVTIKKIYNAWLQNSVDTSIPKKLGI